MVVEKRLRYRQKRPFRRQKSTMKTLTIYSIDSDTMSLIPVVVKKEEKTLTAEYITYLVTQNLEDEDVRVDHVEQQKNVVVVSFDSKAKPVKRCSKQMETLILNCFASSLLDNVKDCKKNYLPMQKQTIQKFSSVFWI